MIIALRDTSMHVCVCEHEYTTGQMCVTLYAVVVKAWQDLLCIRVRTLLPHRHTLFTLTLCHLRDGSNSECRRAADAEMSSFSSNINWEWWPVSAFHFKTNSQVPTQLRPTACVCVWCVCSRILDFEAWTLKNKLVVCIILKHTTLALQLMHLTFLTVSSQHQKSFYDCTKCTESTFSLCTVEFFYFIF